MLLTRTNCKVKIDGLVYLLWFKKKIEQKVGDAF